MSPRGCLSLLLIWAFILGTSIHWTDAHKDRWELREDEFPDIEDTESDNEEEEDDDEEEEEEEEDEEEEKEEDEKENEEEYDDDEETNEKKEITNGETKLLKHCLKLQTSVKTKLESLVDQLKDCSKMAPSA